MSGVILSVIHILSAIFVVFLILRHLYNMYKKIKMKDWRSVVLDVVSLAICTPIFYRHFFVTFDLRKSFAEIITYFS
ncbi:AAA family ATPase [Prevotella nigrescens]|nr:AAA family ATPase [Prevotella nigrescens]